ncbi:SurA N-terminal domain-containing protein [Neisseria montereyensis]|uniref:Periplasmic chaperone PpiD n=1 Tax=Neisseria montereyensis TaxID=2973938 RepID=A0ABT2FBM3_9NEIS|nr:SurA N-terminal domain-containing protein [Neisseria montereyensis]MCS4533500.1 SurA N-terminal domain-containing protein [Neisseria montereyensis]
MFVTIEKYKTPAQILLGLIAITFVGFGVSTVAAPGSDYIVEVGNQKISNYDVDAALQGAQAAEGQDARNSAFQALLQRALLVEGAKKMGFAVSQEQLKQVIVDDPTFHGQDGKFSQALFNQYLSQSNLTEDQLIDNISSEFAVQNLVNLMGSGALISDVQAKQLLEATQAERTIRTVSFPPQQFFSQVKTDDAALKKYYDANKQNYVIPQAAKIEFVALSLQDMAEKQTVSEEELQKAYEQAIAAIKPAREIAHILFSVQQGAPEDVRASVKAEAEKVLAQLKADPNKFADLAKQYSDDEGSASNGGNLGYLPQDGGLLKAFEDRAFELPKGQISELVQTEAGYHIIKILNIREKPTFEEMRAQLENELKQKKATAAFKAAKEQLADEAFNHPDSLNDVAKTMGLKIEAPEDWLTKENGKAAGMPDNLIDVIFSDDVLKQKHNSEPVDVGENVVWVVRVKDVREQSTQTFEQAKDFVKTDYVNSEATKLAEKKAQEALANAQKGKPEGLNWSAVTQMTAETARQSMPPEDYTRLAKARPAKDKPAYVLLSNLPAPVLVEVQSVKVPEDISQQLPAIKQAMGEAQGNSSYNALLSYLGTIIKQKQGAQQLNPTDI